MQAGSIICYPLLPWPVVFVVLALAIVFVVLAVWRGQATVVTIPEANLQSRWLLAGLIALLGTIFFQISLCWGLGCTGISIVWCAAAGWIMNERKSHAVAGDAGLPAVERSALDTCEDVALCALLGVLIYYAVTAAVITSVAHFCALVLGTLLSRVNRRVVLVDSQLYEVVANDATE